MCKEKRRWHCGYFHKSPKENVMFYPAQCGERQCMISLSWWELYALKRSHCSDPAARYIPFHGKLVWTVGVIFLCFFFMFFACLLEKGIVPLSDNSMIGPSIVTLRMLGGINTYDLRRGEWWRFFSAPFLHAGWLHLFVNAVMLYIVGLILEPDWGFFRTGFVFMVSAVLGMLVSATLSSNTPMLEQEQISVGASGGIFGLMGGCIPYVLEYWSTIQEPKRICRIVIISVVVGLVSGCFSFVDNYAHMGGTVAGVLAGFVTISNIDFFCSSKTAESPATRSFEKKGKHPSYHTNKYRNSLSSLGNNVGGFVDRTVAGRNGELQNSVPICASTLCHTEEENITLANMCRTRTAMEEIPRNPSGCMLDASLAGGRVISNRGLQIPCAARFSLSSRDGFLDIPDYNVKKDIMIPCDQTDSQQYTQDFRDGQDLVRVFIDYIPDVCADLSPKGSPHSKSPKLVEAKEGFCSEENGVNLHHDELSLYDKRRSSILGRRIINPSIQCIKNLKNMISFIINWRKKYQKDRARFPTRLTFRCTNSRIVDDSFVWNCSATWCFRIGFAISLIAIFLFFLLLLSCPECYKAPGQFSFI